MAIRAATPMQRRPVVLLVDDEPHVLDGLRLTLRREPYDVLAAQSAREGLEVLRRAPVDLVVADEDMPGMVGSEFLGCVARERPRVARVMLTGRASLDVALRCINDGHVARFLQKPCPPGELRESLAEALRGAAGASAPRPFGGLSPEEVGCLSPREQEVLARLIEGKRLAQVAKALFVSGHTVRNHLKAIFRKLAVHSQAELLTRCQPQQGAEKAPC